jgi:hypothetical protein
MTKPSPFRHFKTSPEIIRSAVILHIRVPQSLRNVEDLLHERGIDISHESAGQGDCAATTLGQRAAFSSTQDLQHYL